MSGADAPCASGAGATALSSALAVSGCRAARSARRAAAASSAFRLLEKVAVFLSTLTVQRLLALPSCLIPWTWTWSASFVEDLVRISGHDADLAVVPKHRPSQSTSRREPILFPGPFIGVVRVFFLQYEKG